MRARAGEGQQVFFGFVDGVRKQDNGIKIRCQLLWPTMIAPLLKPPAELMPGTDITPFTDKVAAIKGVIATNLRKIKEKIDEPRCRN